MTETKMSLKKRKGYKIPSSEITPQSLHMSRRKFMSGAALAAVGVGLAACSPQALLNRSSDKAAQENTVPVNEPDNSFKTLESRVKAELQLAEGSGGLYFEDLADGESIQVNENLIFPSASVIKIPIMVQVMKMAEEEKLDLQEMIDMNLSSPEFVQDEGSGILTQLTSNISMNIRDLTTLMIIISDNLAANQLLKLMEFSDINATMIELGLEHTIVTHDISDWELLDEDSSNPTSPKDMAILLKEMYYKRLPLSDLMIDILKEQKYSSRIPFLLPEDDEEVEIAHKTGSLGDIAHDVGLILRPDFNYVLTALTKRHSSNFNASLTIARISELIYQYMRTKYSAQNSV